MTNPPLNQNAKTGFTHSCLDQLGFVSGEDGRAIALDPVATRRLTGMMRDADVAFKRLETPSLKSWPSRGSKLAL
jgi:hypothetical protein